MKLIKKTLAYTFAAIALSSCSEKDEPPYTPQTYDVQGKVEKGPFVSGSGITVQPMNDKLQVLGSMFNTSITDDLGSFTLGSKEFSTPYAEFAADGYFFNEVSGKLSNGTLTLRAIVNLTDISTVNVNILTHLKYARIKNLVAYGEKFQQANKKAQEELLQAFGLKSYSDNEVASFSITAGTDESAALIAISSLLLMERTEAELTEYLSKLSADFGENGYFSQKLVTQIASDKKNLAKHLNSIRTNIIERYLSLGITIEVKDLSYFIDWDGDGSAGNELLKENESVSIETPVVNVPNQGGNYSIKIGSPITLYLEPQTESNDDVIIDSWNPDSTYGIDLYADYDNSSFTDNDIHFESSLNNNNIINIQVSALQSKTDKISTISLYDYIGNIVGSIELRQEGKVVNIPASEAPLLGKDAKTIMEEIAANTAKGLRDFNRIEQYYNYNKAANTVSDYVYPESDRIATAWNKIYEANSMLLQIRKADESMLNVYGDYCNVLSALFYSTLVYGWSDVPYITDHDQFEQILQQGGIKQQTASFILTDIKRKLSEAIENLPEKKNESTKDANGFFFTSKDVARVLLANIHMYEGNHTQAESLLRKVINNGFYSLDASTNFMPSTTTDANISVSESSEVIFALQNSSGTRAGVSIVGAGVLPYITLSDVYLSLAECRYKSGDIPSANQYIQSVIDAKNLHTSETDVLMKIKEVREHILLYSGTYFAFLKRTGIAKDVCGIEDYRLLFPIPSQELWTNRFMTQNPGY